MAAQSSSDPRALVIAHTVKTAAPLCPELPLRLMTDACELYRGDESAAEEARVALPFWSIAWPGGQAIARFLLDNPHAVKGRRVFDFGCGGAIAGIAAAKCGAASVVANDIDPIALAAAQLNAELNGVTLKTDGANPIDREIDTDVLLAGDVCYNPELTARILGWLRKVAAKRVTVLIGDPGRGHLDRQLLSPIAEYAVAFEGDPTGQLRRATWVGRLTAS
jgi:predicted nicotinamide N-methyase